MILTGICFKLVADGTDNSHETAASGRFDGLLRESPDRLPLQSRRKADAVHAFPCFGRNVAKQWKKFGPGTGFTSGFPGKSLISLVSSLSPFSTDASHKMWC